MLMQVAWVIVNQVLGWITFFAILLIIWVTEFDFKTFFSKIKYLDRIAAIGNTAGNITVAFTVNRLLTPLRIAITTWSMKYTADTINYYADPYFAKLGFEREFQLSEEDAKDFPGIEEETDKAK